MGAFYETLSPSLITWILAQKLFWVATAPLSGSGHVNVSPKGGEYFGILDERTFWYMELTGSGIETQSHLYERGNGRITVLFNAFEGGPKIVRLWGKGRVLENRSKQFNNFITEHDVKTIPGTRAIILVDIHQVGTSCGFSVPFYDFVGFRETLNDHFRKKDEKFQKGVASEGIDRYWAYKNAWSMDGMPAMKRGLEIGKSEGVKPITKMVGPLAPRKYRSANGFALENVVLVALVSFMMGVLMMMYGREVVPMFEGSRAVGYVNVTRISMGSVPLVGHSKR